MKTARNQSLNRILGHTFRTLPDSITERKALLMDILQVLPAKHPLRLSIEEMHRWLVAQEKHQLSLALDFKKDAQ